MVASLAFYEEGRRQKSGSHDVWHRFSVLIQDYTHMAAAWHTVFNFFFFFGVTAVFYLQNKMTTSCCCRIVHTNFTIYSFLF